MMEIKGNDIRSGGQKIGYISGNDIHNDRGEKVGYFSGNDIFNKSGRKVGYIQNNQMHRDDGGTTHLDNIHRDVKSDTATSVERVAAKLLLGD